MNILSTASSASCMNNDVNEICTSVKLEELCKDIEAFNVNLIERSQNEDMNKKREMIVEMIINNKVPYELYEKSNEWRRMRHAILNYLEKVLSHAGINAPLTQVTCATKAGRAHNYDFSIHVVDYDNKSHDLKLELKFNASAISHAPQFVSPMKPSQYMSSSFEEYHYTNYLTQLGKSGNIELPQHELYMKQIHGNKPVCLREFQDKYYAGCKSSSKFSGKSEDVEFYTKANELSKESISSFIANNTLDIMKLSEYLKQTQQGKYYMMFKNGEFHMETVNMDEYELIDVEAEPSKSRYMVTTKTGRKLKVLLRWKNGNGIAYPAFQIS